VEVVILSLIKLQGVVLKSFNLAESDKIITIFTDKLGKVDVAVHGARKAKSKFMSSTQPFCYCEFVVYSGKNLYSLSESNITESFQSLLMDLDKLAYGSYFLEVIDNLTEKENKNVTILALLLKTLYILVHDEIDLRLLRFAFDYKAISISGFMPQINSCIKCREKVEDKAYFSIVEGGIVCAKCASSKNQYPLNRDSIQFLHIIRNIKLEDLRNINYDEKTLSLLQGIFLNYIRYHTGRDFKSLGLISQL
jgi:DNA repair protein RecO (recombination protein O)